MSDFLFGFITGIICMVIVFVILHEPKTIVKKPIIPTIEIQIKNGVNDTTYLYTF